MRRFLRNRRHRDRIVELEQVQGLEQLEQPDGEPVLTHAARPARLDDSRDRGDGGQPPGNGA